MLLSLSLYHLSVEVNLAELPSMHACVFVCMCTCACVCVNVYVCALIYISIKTVIMFLCLLLCKHGDICCIPVSAIVTSILVTSVLIITCIVILTTMIIVYILLSSLCFQSTVVPLDNLRKKPDSDDTKAIPSSASSQNSQSVSIGEAKTHGNQRQHSGRSWRREEHVGNHSKGDRQSGRHWREKDEVQYRDSHHRNDHRRAPESRDYHRNARRKNEHRYQNSPRNDDRNLGNDHSDRRRGQADYHRSYRDNRRGHTEDNQDVAQDSNDHVDDRKNRQKDGRNNHRHIEDVGNNVRGGREVHADEEDRESHREKGDSGKNHSRDPHYHGRDSGRNRRGRRGPQHRGEGPPENREVVQKSYEDSRENDIIRTSQGNDESKQGEQGKDIPRNVSRQGGERRDYRDSKSHSGHEGNDDCARDGERTFPRDKHDDAGSLDGNRSLRQLEQHHRTEHRTDREHPRTDHRQDREFHRGGSRGRYRGNRHVGQRGGKRGESGNPGEIHRSRDGQHGYGEQMGREGEISHSSHSRHPHSAMGGGSSGETDREMERTSIRMDDNLVDNPDGGLSSSQHFNAHPKEAEGKGFHPRHRTDFRRGGRRGGWRGRERNNHDSEPGLDNAHPSHNGPGCDLNLPAEKDRHKSSSIRDGGSNSHDNDRWRKEGSGEASTQWHDNQFDNRRSKPSQKGEWRGKGNSSRWEPQDRVNVDKPSPAQIHMSDSNPERVSGHGAPPGFPSRSGPPPGFSQRHGKKGSPHGGRGDTEIPVVAPPPGFEFS